MILILGGTGYVGCAFQAQLLRQGREFRVVSRRDLDYTRPELLRGLLREAKPSFLINCSGYTGQPNVDVCESHKDECLRANAFLPGVIREVCAEAGLPWGHVSSGCIFTGHKKGGTTEDPHGFTEEDPPNFSFLQGNCSYYSGTKVLGEKELGYRKTREGIWQSDMLADVYIWRMRMPFNNASNPRNYLAKVAAYPRLLEVRNSPSHLDEFVRACLECLDRRVPFGIYNMTNPGSILTSEIAALMKQENERRRAEGLPRHFPEAFEFFENEGEFMHTAAVAPRSSCVLDSRKLAAAGIHMTPVREAVTRALREWNTPAS